MIEFAIIPWSCIVGAKNLVISVVGSKRQLIEEAPAAVRKAGVEWSR